MPIERYKVGRKYTERLYTSADFTDPAAVREVLSALAASDYSVEARLTYAERRATAHLKRVKMPLDPNAWPYGDPTWLRENERKSLDWYAINILNTIRMLRDQIERGAVTIAVDFALDVGVLATEAKTIQYIVGNTNRGGEDFKASRLEDVDGLETEDVHVGSSNKTRWNLQENGATPEEIDFLLEQRVELNAFASDEFVEWIEGKLQEHGVTKVIPDGDTLANAYRRMRKQALVQERINEALDELEDDDTESVSIPANLIGRIKERLSDDPALRWDAVLQKIANDDHDEPAP